MKIWLSRDGLYVWLREPRGEEIAKGFVLKLKRRMRASERLFGPYRRAFAFGPFYFRTYARRR